MSVLETSYRRPARILHWLVAAIVLYLVVAGFAIVYIEEFPGKETIYNLHRSFGFVVLVLMVIRLGYRIMHPPPQYPDYMPPLQKFVAGTVHGLLYAILLINPVVGWVATSAYPAPIWIFGLFELPPLVGKNEMLSKLLFDVHHFLGIATVVMVAIHVGGAVFHQMFQKDNIIRRMWPL